MPCIPQEVDMNPQMQVGDANLSTCRVHRTNLQKGTHCESHLKAGEEYFFVLVTPEDPNSFVSVSDTKRQTVQSPVRPNSPLFSGSPRLGSHSAAFSSPSVDDEVDGGPHSASAYDDSMYTSEPESPEVDESAAEVDDSPHVDDATDFEDWAPPPVRSLVAAQQSRPGAVSRAPNRSACNIAPGSFSKSSAGSPSDHVMLTHRFPALGPRLETLEVLELALARDRWYKALNSDNVLAVIGIAKGENILPGESRKRRRID